ncbi:MAG: hypothetical protein AAF657_03830, partial [Acidobacteriota bacterium]
MGLATLLIIGYNFALPNRLLAQLPPPPPPPGGPAVMAQAEVLGLAGGTYSRFEIELFESPDGSNAMDLGLPGSLMDVVVSAFIDQPWGEELGLELRIDASVWDALADVMTAVEPFEGTDFDNLSPQDEQDLVDAVDDLVQGLDLPDPSSQMSDM